MGTPTPLLCDIINTYTLLLCSLLISQKVSKVVTTLWLELSFELVRSGFGLGLDLTGGMARHDGYITLMIRSMVSIDL